MALATATLTINSYPTGSDNTQRFSRHFGRAAVGASALTYTAGGIRINFAALEPLKTGPPYLLPVWMDVYSFAGSGYDYNWNPLGPTITNLALTSNVITITAKNNLAAGDVVVLSGLTTTTALNGISLTVLAGSLSATGFTANFTHANIGTAAETGNATPTLYASGLPFQGNLQIFTTGSAAQSALAELANGAVPAAVSGDVIGFRAEFARYN